MSILAYIVKHTLLEQFIEVSFPNSEVALISYKITAFVEPEFNTSIYLASLCQPAFPFNE